MLLCVCSLSSQMIIKCGENKNVAHEAQPSVTNGLTSFLTSSVTYFSMDPQRHGIGLLFYKKEARCKQWWRHLCIRPPIDHKKEQIKTNRTNHIRWISCGIISFANCYRRLSHISSAIALSKICISGERMCFIMDYISRFSILKCLVLKVI